MRTHEAFHQSKGTITSDGYSMAEANALLESGLSDDEWYAMPREARARRTLHLMLKNAVETLSYWANKPKKE